VSYYAYWKWSNVCPSVQCEGRACFTLQCMLKHGGMRTSRSLRMVAEQLCRRVVDSPALCTCYPERWQWITIELQAWSPVIRQFSYSSCSCAVESVRRRRNRFWIQSNMLILSSPKYSGKCDRWCSGLCLGLIYYQKVSQIE